MEREIKKKDLLNEFKISDNALMVLGFAPVIGEVADFVLLSRYIKRGEYLYAGLMLIALIPTVGDFIAKPLIKGIQLAGKGGRAAMKSGSSMGKFLSKNPALKKQFTKVSKHLDNPKVKKVIETANKKNPTLGKGLSRSIDELKGVGKKLSSPKTAGKVKNGINALKTPGRTSKSFFKEKKLSEYTAKMGHNPKTWVSKWWNVTMPARRGRRNAFRKVIIGSEILSAFGLTGLSDTELESRMKDPKFVDALSKDPQVSDFVANNTSSDDLSKIEGGNTEQPKPKSNNPIGDGASLDFIKSMAKMLT